MLSINLVMHVFSAIAFVILTAMFLRTRSTLKTQKDFIQCYLDKTQRKLSVTSPKAFLRKFSSAFDINLDERSPLSTDLQKINVAPWVHLHFNAGIRYLEVLESKGKQQVSVTLQNPGALSEDAKKELKASLGEHAEITL